MSEDSELLDFFKAMANADRIKIAGLLGVEPLSVAKLAERLGMKPMAVASHVERLEALELVRNEGGVYHLNVNGIEAMSRRVLAGRRPQVKPEDFEGEAFERKVLSDFILPNGRLKSIPSQQKKLVIVLQHVAQTFEPGERYTEKQVNEKLQLFYNDSASLRRYMIDNSLLQRSSGGKEYWRPED
jgi:DNA-binding transcriptional ArsR family regulator